jgi:hypothetical protein
MVMLPVLFFPILLRKFLVHRLTPGALKGQSLDDLHSPGFLDARSNTADARGRHFCS